MEKQVIVVNTATAKKRALAAVNGLMSDHICQVTIEDYKHDKTAQQRGFWHVLIGIMAKELGYTPLEMKNILKVKIMGTEIVKDLDGNDLEQIPSSEAEKRHGYSLLIDGTIEIGHDLGMNLPLPNA